MVNTAGAARWCGQTIEGRAAFGQGNWVFSKQARLNQRDDWRGGSKTATALQPAASVMPCFVSCASSGDNPHLESLALPLARSGRGEPDARFF